MDLKNGSQENEDQEQNITWIPTQAMPLTVWFLPADYDDLKAAAAAMGLLPPQFVHASTMNRLIAILKAMEKAEKENHSNN